MADLYSRCFTENTEWALNTDVFANIVHTFFLPEIDLFASALNYKVLKYVSWLPDPNDYAVDAFTITWKDFYAFPPFSILTRVLAKIVTDRSIDNSKMDNSILVSTSIEPTHTTPSRDCSLQKFASIITPTNSDPPTLQEALPPGSSFIGEALAGFGLPTATANLIKESWHPSTRAQYDSLLCGWTTFCSSRKVYPMSPTIHDILAYLTSMFECGLEYSTISAAKIVLSSILHIPPVTAISEHSLIIRLLKGIFHVRPPRPRYELIWDTGLVLTYLKGL